MPGPGFRQRSDDFGRWVPPGAHGSNVLVNDVPLQYQYDDWQAQRIGPTATPRRHYKTCSLYAEQDRIWMWPEDATQNGIGDAGMDEEGGSNSSTSSAGGEVTQDWAELKFHWHNAQMFYRSYTAQGRLHGQVQCQTPNTALHEVLPDQYLAPQQHRNVPPTHGGLTGELPILIGLIALSVPPPIVDAALQHCLRSNYRPHHRSRGAGCTASGVTSSMLPR